MKKNMHWNSVDVRCFAFDWNPFNDANTGWSNHSKCQAAVGVDSPHLSVREVCDQVVPSFK